MNEKIEKAVDKLLGESKKSIKESTDGHEALEKWMDKTNSWQGGARVLEKLARALDPENYTSLEYFLDDNPGLMEVISEWIGDHMTPEWAENLQAAVGEDEDEEDPGEFGGFDSSTDDWSDPSDSHFNV